MDNKNKKILIVIGILVFILLLAGGTFAYWDWATTNNEKTNITFVSKSSFSCGIDGGGSIKSGDTNIVPATCTNSEHAIIKEINLTTTINDVGKTIYSSLWLDVNSLATNLVNSENFKYAITKSNNSCDDPIVEGSFGTNTKIDLLKDVPYTATTTDTYYLYIWLDKAEENVNTANQGFDLSIGGSCTDVEPPAEPNAPVVVEGLIPVTLSSSASGPVVTTAVPNSEWYNYSEKEWANAVLVKNNGTQNRSYYKGKYESGEPTVIDNSDILAYYVWIPRYSYKMNGKTEAIDISFNSTAPEGYTSHPAFEFNGGVDGIWVGKFESSQGTSNTTGDTTSPIILPSVAPWVAQNISTQFQTSLKFAGGTLSNGVVTFSNSTTYGLTSTTDSHMMKNSEWGAVAYLSHSIYGTCTGSTCTEVGINNYYNAEIKTGCGDVAGTAQSTTCTNEFGKVDTYPQSTNGNITGIFDMSGGVSEYVMGVFANSSGTLWTGAGDTTNHSGFNGAYGSSGNPYTSGIPFPTETKYYDVYKATSGTTIRVTTACNGGVCYGHALSETSGWYSDSASFVSSSNPWFLRGDDITYGASAGVFSFRRRSGSAFSDTSWRSVLVG